MSDSKVAELMALAYRVNQETDRAVFVQFSGHVNKIHLFVSESKEKYGNWIFDESVYVEDAAQVIDGWMEYLKNVSMEVSA